VKHTFLDRRPIVIALAGPNGAGKSTFYFNHLADTGLRLVNADILAKGLGIAPYHAAEVAGALRWGLLRQRESFVFETVFSDPARDKLSFLKHALTLNYTVLLCFIGVSSASVSQARVAMRVSQGGHNVPVDKLFSRYPRVLSNLRAALQELPNVWVFDNSDLARPYRRVAVVEDGKIFPIDTPTPAWLRPLLPQ